MPSRIEQLNQELMEDLLGRGPGDPDRHGHYPGDSDEKDCLICNPITNDASKIGKQE